MNEEKKKFSNIQRRNSAVIAKYEWASSLMGMRKTGNEVHDRRNKIHQKANEFLQGLLQKRSDGSLLDDHGTLDRYQKFLKYKSNFHDDDDILNEFDRRLRALNKERRNETSKYHSKSYNKELMTIGLQTTEESESDTQRLNITDRSKSMISSNNSLLSIISSEDNQTDILSYTDDCKSSSSDYSIARILHKPKARRADGSEIIETSTKTPLHRASSNLLIFNHCHFPRTLKSREQGNTNPLSEKQVSSPIRQYDNNQLFHLLDQIENDCSPYVFTTLLNQLTLSFVPTDELDLITRDHDHEEKENLIMIPNLFDQPSLSDDYFTTFHLNIDNPRKIFVYTMTIGTVQLSPSLTVPYSILNGRRPLLQCSVQTNFKQIYSKRSKHTCQVTAIESFTNIQSLKENDIILKINDQSVWCLTTETVRDILQQTKSCLLTIARLSQPFV